MDVASKQNGCADSENSGGNYMESPVSNAVSEPKKLMKESYDDVCAELINEVTAEKLNNGSVDSGSNDPIMDSVNENLNVNCPNEKKEDEQTDHNSGDGDNGKGRGENLEESIPTIVNCGSNDSVNKVDIQDSLTASENVETPNSENISEGEAVKNDENNSVEDIVSQTISETKKTDLSGESAVQDNANAEEKAGGVSCSQENEEKESNSELSNDSIENKGIASPDDPVTIEQDIISIKDDNSNSSSGDDSSRSIEMVSVGDADDEDSRDIDVSIKDTVKKDEGKKSEKSASKSVEKMTVDGDEFLITINEDDDDDENANVSTKADKNNSNKNDISKIRSSSSAFGKKTVVSSSGVKYITIGGPSPPRVQTPVVNRSILNQQTLLVPQTGMPMATTSNRNMMQYYVPTASQAMNSMVQQAMNVQQHSTAQGYVTKVGNQTVYVPFTRQATPIQSHYVTAGMAQTSFMSTTTTRMPQTSFLHQKTANQQRVVAKTPVAAPVEMVLPQSSMDQIAMLIWELKMRKIDNSNWAGSFPVKPQAELGTVTKFLLDLGHDVVKESVYKDIVSIQTKKEKEGTLSEKQKDNLTEMRTVLEELENKVGHTHVKLSMKCKGCAFRTESSNALYTHRLQPHLRHPSDPTTDMLCVNCGYITKFPPAFNSHMEVAHKKKAYMIDRKAMYECDLCGFDNTQKGRMTQHKFKCAKHFKLGSNLAPFYSDVNFCLKNTFYYKRIVEKVKVCPTRQAAAKPINIQPRPIVAPKVARPTPGQIQFKVVPPAVKKPLVSQVALQTAKPNIQGNATVKAQLQQIHLQQQTGNLKQSNTSQSKVQASGAGFEVCELCGGFVKDRAALHVHFYYAHKVSIPQKIFEKPQAPLFCRVCLARFWTAQGLAKHKTSTNHREVATPMTPLFTAPTPVKTKCWICLQCPDNIVHHMQSVHAMTFNDLLVQEKCVFCGISIGNKKSMELHMSAAHGVVIKGNTLVGPLKPSVKPMGKPLVSPQASPAGPARQNMVRNNFCVFCGISFSDNAQLTLHCIKRHATCRECGMVVARSLDLVNHSCTKRVPKSCQVCGLRNLKAQYYNKHVLTHLKKCKIELHRLTNGEIMKATKRPLEYFIKGNGAKKAKIEETVVLDISSGDEEESSINKKEKPISKSDADSTENIEKAASHGASPDTVGKSEKCSEDIDNSIEENACEMTEEKAKENDSCFSDINVSLESNENTDIKMTEDSNNSSTQEVQDTESPVVKSEKGENCKKISAEEDNVMTECDLKEGKSTATHLLQKKDTTHKDAKMSESEGENKTPELKEPIKPTGEKDNLEAMSHSDEDSLRTPLKTTNVELSVQKEIEPIESPGEKDKLEDISRSDDDSPRRTPVKNMKIELNVQEESSSSDDESEGSNSSKSRKRKFDNDTSAFCIKRRK